MQPGNGPSFAIRRSSRWAIAYVLASYADGVAFLAWHWHSTGQLYSDPAELVFPLAFPLILPWGMFLGLGSFEFGLRAALPVVGMYVIFVVAFTVVLLLLRRRSATVV